MFEALLRVGNWLRPLMPLAVRAKLPAAAPASAASRRASSSASNRMLTTSGVARHQRRVVMLEGCVQPGLAPEINAAAARVLDRLDLSIVHVRGEACCGALAHHLGRTETALGQARRNVEACEEQLDAGAECVVSTASACGLMVKDYGRLLAGDPSYAARARRVSEATRDLSEIIEPADLGRAGLVPGEGPRVAWQSPCTLQHGQRNVGRVEALLAAAGYSIVPVKDAGLCCGSAGTYSLTQRDLSRELRTRKLESLMAGRPDVIATANVGCLTHLRETSPAPVRHWIELVDAALPPA